MEGSFGEEMSWRLMALACNPFLQVSVARCRKTAMPSKASEAKSSSQSETANDSMTPSASLTSGQTRKRNRIVKFKDKS